MARFDNMVKGVGRLLKRLKEQDATLVVCEVTGGYERPLVTRLRRTEITMHVAHPNRVHAFVKAYGVRSRDRPAGRPGALAIRTGLSGCTDAAA